MSWRGHQGFALRIGSIAIALSCAVVGQSFVAPTVARAQTSEGAEVDDLIARGITLRRSGDDVRALAVFQRAERLEPESTRVRVHLAATYQALGQWEDADRYLALALANPNDPYVQKHEAILASARRTIDSHMATLDLMGGPRGAQVRLNGRPLGTLPLEAPVRVAAGIYTLEARLGGHYPVTRSVALGGGAVVREQLILVPLAPADEPLQPRGNAKPASATWLPWTLAGLAAGAGVGAAVALGLRESHVSHWNDDDRCQPANGMTREQACGDEREAGEQAETWMWIGTAAAGAFAAASVVSFLILDTEEEADPSSLGVRDQPRSAFRCAIGVGELFCAGRF